MTVSCGSFGSGSRLAIASSGAIGDPMNAATMLMSATREDLTVRREFGQARGLSGTVNPRENSSQRFPSYVDGGFACEVGAAELPMIGAAMAAGGGNDHDGSALDITVDRDGTAAGYRHCLVRGGMLQMRSGQPMQARLKFIGIEQVAATMPSLTRHELPFWTTYDTSVTFGSETFPIIGFDLSVWYGLWPVYRGSMTPIFFHCLSRQVALRILVPHDSATSSATDAAIDTQGAVTLTMSPSHLPASPVVPTSTIDIPSGRVTDTSAPVSGRDEIPGTILFSAEQSGDSAKILTFSNSE
jgi:hypothetical protein